MQLLLNIDVDDLERAVRFYAGAFDLHASRQLGANAVEMLGGPVPLYLLAQPSGSKVSDASRQVRDFTRHWTPVHFDVVVDDLDSAVERAVAAGALLEAPICARTWGRMALLADPFGNGFCLLQFTADGYASIASPI